ncbi:hypothetical protein DPMN_139267 [Dreissena polymorpha]|uniref:Uncharacterized protein n=1 Tax=Dreissena polymorpha TaxID=45954 RepID=A0A9D4G886_DREPO|nr:hypothetical protein DPMN_139267 [Dreissena polymorpha]
MKENNDVVILDMCDIKQYGKSYPKLTVPGKGLMSHGTVISQDRSGNDYLVCGQTCLTDYDKLYFIYKNQNLKIR